ncbi:MAG: ATP-binding protein [bacterium]
MVFEGKPLESVKESDLQDLVENRVSEGRTLEYKECLPEDNRDAKKEFLFDVSSFANAAGGHLILGIKEDHETKEPVSLCGLGNIVVDSEKRRLDSMIQDGIDPRLPGVSIYAVPLRQAGSAIIIRIPKSFRSPHMVTFAGSRKFYSRNSGGKYLLGVDELRTAFLLSDTIAKRVRDFRAERLSAIIARQTPVTMNEGAKIVLHIVPLGSFDPAAKYDVSSLAHHIVLLQPIYARSWNPRHNFDGFLTYTDFGPFGHTSYVQVFRNGIIEVVDVYLLRDVEGKHFIPSARFEKELMDATGRCLSVQTRLGVEPPILLMLSLLGVSGYSIGVSADPSIYYGAHYVNMIDRETLLVPEVMLESMDCDIAQGMRPIFDAVWNAAGWARSMNYDQQGKWTGHYQ